MTASPHDPRTAPTPDEAAGIASELPAGEVRIGPNCYVRVYGFSDITPALVEVRIVDRGEQVINLTVQQAEALGVTLIAAANKARAR